MATVGWLKSSLIPHRATQAKKAQDNWMAKVPINVSENCMTGLNESGPVSVLLRILFLRILGIRTSTTEMRLSNKITEVTIGKTCRTILSKSEGVLMIRCISLGNCSVLL